MWYYYALIFLVGFFNPYTITWFMIFHCFSILDRISILTTLRSVEKSVKMLVFLVHRNNQKLRDKRYKWKHSCVKLLVRQPSCIYRFNWYSLTLPLIVSYVDNDKLQLVRSNWKQDFQCSWWSFSCHFNTGSGQEIYPNLFVFV